ncbi:MAG: bifunctional nuclease family protein [Bacteroidales bacterium]
MAKIKLKVQGLAGKGQSDTLALMLVEESGLRGMPVIVGLVEAQAIALALEHIKPPRPLTHDLFYSFARTFGIRLKNVYIYKFDKGVYYSELSFEKDGKTVKMDSRTSDAVSLALRAKCSIYTDEKIFEECGIPLKDILPSADKKKEKPSSNPEEVKDKAQLRKMLSSWDDDKLKQHLEKAISKENYEYATLYRNELQRRQKERR